MVETTNGTAVVEVETDLGEVDDQRTENFKFLSSILSVYLNDQLGVLKLLADDDILFDLCCIL